MLTEEWPPAGRIDWNHDEADYRCLFPAKYALASRPEHPEMVYVETRSRPGDRPSDKRLLVEADLAVYKHPSS